jgi:hypothetical protein
MESMPAFDPERWYGKDVDTEPLDDRLCDAYEELTTIVLNHQDTDFIASDISYLKYCQKARLRLQRYLTRSGVIDFKVFDKFEDPLNCAVAIFDGKKYIEVSGNAIRMAWNIRRMKTLAQAVYHLLPNRRLA